jgi:hypothetical protein
VVEQNFDKKLNSEVEHYATRYGFKADDRGRGFEGYLVHLFAQEYGFESHLEGLESTDPDLDLSDQLLRSDDLGVDVVLVDEDHKRLMIVQAKWDGSKHYPSEEELNSTFGLHERLMSQEFVATGGDHARELLGHYSEMIEAGYQVLIRFVTNKPIVSERHQKFDAARKAKQEAYEAAGSSVLCELISKSGLKNLEAQVSSASAGLLGEVSLSVQSDSCVEFHEPRHCLVGRMSGNALRDLYLRKDVSQKLFAMNIRLPMTMQRQTNKQIQRTAREDAEGFFFFNNGVSAVCEEFTYHPSKNEIVARRFQIINGAQTVGAIASAGVDLAGVHVLFRLSATDETTGGPFTDQIIEFNNTQNPTIASDFRSNDKIQSFLRDELPRFLGKGAAPSRQYIPKRGAKRKGRGGRELTPTELAKVRHAFLYGPCISYSEPKSFFDRSDSGRYPQAFGIEGVQCDSWSDDSLAECVVALTIDERMRNFAKETKKSDPDNDEGRFLQRLSQYVVALAGVGLRLTKGQEWHTYEELLSSTQRFEAVVVPHLTIARRLLRAEWRIRQDQGQVQPHFNLGRDPSTWSKLSKDMEVEVKAEILA